MLFANVRARFSIDLAGYGGLIIEDKFMNGTNPALVMFSANWLIVAKLSVFWKVNTFLLALLGNASNHYLIILQKCMISSNSNVF